MEARKGEGRERERERERERVRERVTDIESKKDREIEERKEIMSGRERHR